MISPSRRLSTVLVPPHQQRAFRGAEQGAEAWWYFDLTKKAEMSLARNFEPSRDHGFWAGHWHASGDGPPGRPLCEMSRSMSQMRCRPRRNSSPWRRVQQQKLGSPGGGPARQSTGWVWNRLEPMRCSGVQSIWRRRTARAQGMAPWSQSASAKSRASSHVD